MPDNPDKQDIPDKPIYADVQWLATVQRQLQKEISKFAERYPQAVKVDDTGRLRVLPVAPVRDRQVEES